MLFVELDLFPTSQVTLFLPKDSGYVEIPTQPTLLQEATQTAADVVAKLRDADIDGLVNAMRDAARGVNDLAGSPELRQTLVAIRDTLATTRETLVEVKPRIAPLAGRFDSGVSRLEATLQQLDLTLGSVKTSLGSFDTLVDPQAPLVYQLTTTLTDLSEAARSIRQFADYLDRNPNALLTGRPKQ